MAKNNSIYDSLVGVAEKDLRALLDTIPFSSLNATSPEMSVHRREDGELILSSAVPIGNCERSIVAYLRRHAQRNPERTMLAQRDGAGGWQTISYLQMKQQADAIGQSLIDLGLGQGDTVLILSENSIEHAVMALGAMTVGVTVAPLTPAYSLRDMTFGKIKHIWGLLQPALVFVQDAERYSRVLSNLPSATTPVVSVDNSHGYLSFADLIACAPTSAVDDAYAQTGHDTIAKVLFTSGSTGLPKGVINTQRMLCVNMAMQDALWLHEENDRPYVTVNWMPWNHTMAGNGLFNRSLRQGGTYYIDHGKPIPGEYGETISLFKEIAPHSHSDVPSGFLALADALEADHALNRKFFSNLQFLQYAGAGLPDSVWLRMQRLSVAAKGELTPFVTGYGCTEAGPLITQLSWPVRGSGIIGIPAPGMEIKLIPLGDNRFELRARGKNLTPGYIRQPELSAAVFDDEGFYKTEDSVTFVDENVPEKGLRFASRVAEDFKLLTGTFVAAGIVRSKVLAKLAPLVTDCVLVGEGRPCLGLLAWPNIGECRKVSGAAGQHLSDQELLRHPKFLSRMRSALAEYNRFNQGSSTRIARILLMDEPPSSEHYEITEKGYVNQRGVINRRAHLVAALYGEPGGHGDVVVVDEQ